MLSFEDPRWKGLKAGYRTPIDVRPILRRLESDRDSADAWHELWEELHHQGDVGEGSFVAVLHLVRIHRLRGKVDWYTYALAATIELARGRDKNPDVPGWARDSYDEALRELGRLGVEEVTRASDKETVRSPRLPGDRAWGTYLRSRPPGIHRGRGPGAGKTGIRRLKGRRITWCCSGRPTSLASLGRLLAAERQVVSRTEE